MTTHLSTAWCAPYLTDPDPCPHLDTLSYIEGCLFPEVKPGPCKGSGKGRQPRKKKEKKKQEPAKPPSRAAGRDLTGVLDFPYFDKLSTNPRTGNDDKMSALARIQGFDGKPNVLPDADLDKLLDSGGIEVFLSFPGTTDPGRVGADGKPAKITGQEQKDQFINGKAVYAGGPNGSGIYTNPTGGKNSTRAVLIPNAKVISYDDAVKAAKAEADQQRFAAIDAAYAKYTAAKTPAARAKALAEFKQASEGGSPQQKLLSDPARWAMTHGYDAVKVPGSGGGKDSYMVLNRTALAVPREVKKK